MNLIESYNNAVTISSYSNAILSNFPTAHDGPSFNADYNLADDLNSI
ncbi:hypothetical protein [Sphingobacterium siyangense]|uniref:Uncharacterized protein n=1 Tax=Sphingobacterium siyangense TaxID=459529 RepID=A0A562M6Z5_9SPHI|nr:hypothetical protein [Sphingobacterium siyangense]TWI15705.1 hypothetical protein IQ31_04863 [Sphingobacterium siyangense]